MLIVYAVTGLLIGLVLGGMSQAILGGVVGLAIGLLLAMVAKLQAQLSKQERHLQRIGAALDQRRPPEPSPDVMPREPTEARSFEPPPPPPVPEPPLEPATMAEREGVDAPKLAGASRLEEFFDTARIWLTTGNVPVKVGVIVSFFGFAFLLKYAADHELLTLPIEVRLLAVAAVGVGLLVVGWRLRHRVEVYALSLQGGGVGILYLTIFAAMRLFNLVPVRLAFPLLVALMICAGGLAVLQNSRALAILGIVGGFLAPILVSTGSGNHVILFSYYLVLNGAILGIAWFRAWRELNLIGFWFTFVIGGLWGYQNYRPELFASTEPFLIAYFLFYQAIAILFAARKSIELRGLVDGTLVFGTPVVAFALQARLVDGSDFGLAISAAVVAVFYVITATLLQRLRPEHFRHLVEAFAALGIAFATLAIPLALDARWTAAAWALEGAALVWLGARQKRPLASAAGFVLVIGAGVAFATYGWQRGQGLPVLNGNLLGGWLISVAGLLSARHLRPYGQKFAKFFHLAALGGFFWGVLWWIGSGLAEIYDRVPSPYVPTATVTLLAGSAMLLLAIGNIWQWRVAQATVLALLPALLLPGIQTLVQNAHPLAYFGWLAWPAAMAMQYIGLRSLEERFASPVSRLHAATLIAITALVAWEVAWQASDRRLAAIWAQIPVAVFPALTVSTIVFAGRRVAWPVARHWEAYGQLSCAVLVAFQLAVMLGLNLRVNGAAAPLPYIPLFNPMDVVTLLVMIASANWLLMMRGQVRWLPPERWRIALTVVVVIAFVVSTAALIRSVHHLAAVPWKARDLLDSVLTQAALSLYWGLLGVAGMVWGAVKAQRPIWVIGAGLMGVVVIKLFLVDLGNTGTIARIVSFIGTGALLLVVGYFAPAPPRKAEIPMGASQES
jgi:uncharacterized membrane protein